MSLTSKVFMSFSRLRHLQEFRGKKRGNQAKHRKCPNDLRNTLFKSNKKGGESTFRYQGAKVNKKSKKCC